MVWLGVSVTDPEASELVVRVRVDDPPFAVTVTDVAFVACQLRVTLWPALMEFAFAEKIKAGGVRPLLVPVPLLVLPLEQEHKHNAAAINPRANPRKQIVVIRRVRAK